MSKNTNLSRKVLRTLLTMSLVYSGGMFVAENLAAAATITEPINSSGNRTTVADDVEIALNDGSGTDKAVAIISSASSYSDNVVDLKGNVRVDAWGKYALYAEHTGSGGFVGIEVNQSGDKTVRLLGDVGLGGGNTNYVELDLNNSESYLAGDFKHVTGDLEKSSVTFGLHNGAVWYPAEAEYTNSTDLEHQLVEFKLDGGVIDIYHSQPELVRDDADTDRTFTLKNINDAVSGTDGVTFRIGSDLADVDNSGMADADKIVLEGVSGGIYKIQVVGDASLTGSSSQLGTSVTSVDGVVVATVDGSNLTAGNTIISGEAYTAAETEMDAGLTKVKDFSITPTISNDGGNDWKLTQIDIGGEIVPESKGSAAVFAETGAAFVQNIVAAWRADNNDLVRRMGELRNNLDNTGAWIRVYGGENEVSGNSSSNMKYKATQGGYDWTQRLKSGKLVTGLAVSYLKGDADLAGGSGDITSTMFGVYGSYIGDKGHFADVIAKYGRSKSEFSSVSELNSYDADYASNGFSISAEYGYRRQLVNNYFIEPQAELTYGYLSGSDYTMQMNGTDGASVHNDAYKSLIGRLGFNIGRQNNDNNIYLKCSLAHEFSGDVGVTATYGDVSRNSTVETKDTWLEYGIGFNTKVGKDLNLYGEVERTTGSEVKTKWRGNLGVRCSF